MSPLDKGIALKSWCHLDNSYQLGSQPAQLLYHCNIYLNHKKTQITKYTSKPETLDTNMLLRLI
jgi:hypothetical protein